METDKEYNEFIKLGNLCYPKQDSRGITNFNDKVLEHTFPKKKDLLNKYGITKSEYFVLLMLEGFFSGDVQRPLVYGKVLNDFIKKCIGNFDSLLVKTPKTSSLVIYRQDHYNSLDFYEKLQKEGMHYVCPCFLTASTDDYDNSRNVKLLITPKVKDETIAHDVYKIINHGEDIQGALPENQINFERNAEFEITGIDKSKKIPVVFLREV